MQEFIDLKDLPAAYSGDSDFVFDAEEHIAWLKKGEEEEKAAKESREKEDHEGSEKAKEKDAEADD